MHKDIGLNGKDIVTGFEGVITAHASYLTGCDQYCLTAKNKDNHTKALSAWYDINRVEVSRESKKLELETEINQGAMDSPSAY